MKDKIGEATVVITTVKEVVREAAMESSPAETITMTDVVATGMEETDLEVTSMAEEIARIEVDSETTDVQTNVQSGARRKRPSCSS